MPSITQNIEIKFEVFCDTCGNRLCYNTSIRYSNKSNVPQVMVTVCYRCMGRKDDEIEELKVRITELEGVEK